MCPSSSSVKRACKKIKTKPQNISSTPWYTQINPDRDFIINNQKKESHTWYSMEGELSVGHSSSSSAAATRPSTFDSDLSGKEVEIAVVS